MLRKAILASLRGSSQLLGLTQGETDEPVSLLEARARLREVSCVRAVSPANAGEGCGSTKRLSTTPW